MSANRFLYLPQLDKLFLKELHHAFDLDMYLLPKNIYPNALVHVLKLIWLNHDLGYYHED